ncbi:uncharacterized protein LOC111266674 [Varroa jacobsoni]|uniref:Uncharacterized protein n=2 Tax=Varroa destructor TaxID=109461 RepID=A0A7M7L0M4_VARDE|nr:uncharacterized protein LOC111253362 isoform X1 [Varroa destructor]XP_022700095.1 uncharacterized protein LOC111266674 [Varroa jacobsoni]
MARKKRTSKLPQSVINSSPYLSPALLSAKSSDQLLQFIQMQQYRELTAIEGMSSPTPTSHYLQYSCRHRGTPTSAHCRDSVLTGGYLGGYQKRSVYHSERSSRLHYSEGGYIPSIDCAADQLGQRSGIISPRNSCFLPNTSTMDTSQMLMPLSANDMELATAVASCTGMVPFPCSVGQMPSTVVGSLAPLSATAASPGVTALNPAPAPLIPPPAPLLSPPQISELPSASSLIPSLVQPLPTQSAGSPPPILHSSMTSLASNFSPWTCDEGHELCPQFGLHQCSCSPTALASEVIHDMPRPVPQPCFGSGDEILAISGSFPCIHFRFANLQPWLYYSICVEFAASAPAENRNSQRDSLILQSNTSVRFLPPGNHMPGHLWMNRRWSLQLEQIVMRIPHLPFGEFTPVVRLFATRGQLCQGLSLEGHPSDMIEASQNWYLSGHSFLLCPWGIDQRVLISTVAITSNHVKVDDIVERSSPLGRTLSDISDPLSLSDSQSPPPCPREPWLDVGPLSCSSPDSVWGPPKADGGCSSDDPILHRMFNNLFPEGYFDESACVATLTL